ERGGYPEHCDNDQPITEVARKVASVTYPSFGLARHEWDTHGRCTGLDSLTYFRAADKAFTAVHIPPRFEAPERPLRMSADDIVQAFVAANAGWSKDDVAVTCKDGRLSELRVCLDKDLNPHRCGRDVSTHCRGTLTVDPIR